jgi:hypothetical protein
MEPSQEEIITHVSTFVTILAMTRDMKFLNWSSGTVAKAFGWAEVVTKYGEMTTDELNFMKSSTVESISFLTTRPIDVVREPYELILKAILTSPLLSWCRNAIDITKETFERFKNAHTIDRVVYSSIPILRDSIFNRMEEKRQHESICLSPQDSAKEALGIELMCAIASSADLDTNGTVTFDEDIISKLSIKVRGNLMFGEIFATGLLLSPGQVMCGQVVISHNIDPAQIIKVTSHPRMWNILEVYASQSAGAFIDSFESSTLSRLVHRSVSLKQAILSVNNN